MTIEAEKSRSLMSRGADILLGVAIGNAFRVVEILGEGMEKVYEWVDRDYGRHMATLRSDPIEEGKYASLAVIDKRNRFIGTLRKTRELYQRKRLLPALLLRAVTKVVVAETKLAGHQYLDFFRENMGRQQLTIAANHTSDADHPSLALALTENGYPDLAEHLYFPSGLKMWDRPYTRWGMRGMNTFPIATPGYFDEALKMGELPLSAKQRKLLEEYKSSMDWLNRASFRTIISNWQKEKAVVVVYPETTRSRDGLLKKGRSETGVYFRRGLTLPVRIEGLDEILPPERMPNLEKILKRKVQVTVSAGRPIDTNRLWFPQTLEWLNEKEAHPVDFVMSRIHILNPERTDPKIRPFYERLSEDIPEGLLLCAA